MRHLCVVLGVNLDEDKSDGICYSRCKDKDMSVVNQPRREDIT